MRMTRSLGRLPDFLTIGAAKAGTTSLHFYLSLHPEVFMSKLKSPDFLQTCLNHWGDGIAVLIGIVVSFCLKSVYVEKHPRHMLLLHRSRAFQRGLPQQFHGPSLYTL